MKRNIKESRLFHISVEGDVCETLYFKHLAKIINASKRNIYNLKVSPKKATPIEYAKRNSYKPTDKDRNGKTIPYIHIQDIEDYHDSGLRARFFGIIDEMREATDKYGIEYKLGYSNYTFELWMLLHVTDMNYAVSDRKAYLKPINTAFNKSYISLEEFKSEAEFQAVLEEFVTIDSVLQAVDRAQKIVDMNKKNGKQKENYRNFEFYRDNPDITVHQVVKLMLDVCKVK